MNLEDRILKFLLENDKKDSGFWWYYKKGDKESAWKLLAESLITFIQNEKAETLKEVEGEGETT